MVWREKDGGRVSGQKQLGFLINLKETFKFHCITYTQFPAQNPSMHLGVLLPRITPGNHHSDKMEEVSRSPEGSLAPFPASTHIPPLSRFLTSQSPHRAFSPLRCQLSAGEAMPAGDHQRALRPHSWPEPAGATSLKGLKMQGCP